MLTRRSFLAGGALAGGAAFATSFALREAAAEPQELRIPELIDARSHGQSVALKAQADRTAFFPGRESRTLGYNGSYLGPTLRVHRGDDVEVAVTNALGEETTVHWHGLLIAGELDGGPHQMIRRGATLGRSRIGRHMAFPRLLPHVLSAHAAVGAQSLSVDPLRFGTGQEGNDTRIEGAGRPRYLFVRRADPAARGRSFSASASSQARKRSAAESASWPAVEMR